MGMTMAEKLFTRKNTEGKAVQAGDFITAKIDGAMLTHCIDEIHHRLVGYGHSEGLPRIWDPDRVYYYMDHFQPAPNLKMAERNRVGREMARKLGICHMQESTPSIAHQCMREDGRVRPGELILGIDSHSTIYGALNCAGTGLGEADMAYALVFGELWFQVPESVRINLHGNPRPYPFGKDIMLYLSGMYGEDFAQYKSIEYLGPAADAMPIHDRLTLSCHAVEVGAKFGLFRANSEVLDYVRARTDTPFTPLDPDPDARYALTIDVDVDALDFYVAKPHGPSNAVPVTETLGVPIVQAVIGSCANGEFEDIEIAARILAGKRVPKHVRLLVQPASWAVYRRCLREGLIETLLDAGAQFLEPGCGTCQPWLGYLAPGETCITTTTRNYKGRLGSTEAFIYLAGPATVAASALAGEIASPKEVLA